MQIETNIPSETRSTTRAAGTPPNLIEEVWRLYDRALAATSNGIAIADARSPDKPIVYCNPAFEMITGYDRSEIIGRNCRFLQGPDTDRNALAQIRVALQEEHDCKVVLKNYRKDGTAFWNELTISPVRDSNGCVTHFIGVQSDITDRKLAEEALRNQEYWLKTAIDAVPDAINLTDSEGRWLIANDCALKLLGWETADYQGKTTAELATTADPRVREILLTWQETDEITWKAGTIASICQTVPLPTGGSNLFEVRKVPLFNPDGTRKGMAVAGRDITQEVEAEAALRDSEQRFRAIFERAAIGMTVATLEGMAIATNPAFQAMLGISEAELRGVDLDEWAHPEDAKIDRELRQELATGWREAYQIEKRYLPKDGSIRWGRLSASVISTSHGTPQFILEMVEDITDRKHAESALLQNEAKWRSLIFNSSDIITILDENGRIVYESPSVETVLGYEPDELVGQMVLDFIHPDDIPSVISQLETVGANPGDQIALEGRFRCADGSWGFLEGVGINLLADPAVSGIVVNSRDMTARRQAEYRLSRINECFLGFSSRADDNIGRLTALAGELLGGTCALYSKLDDETLRAIATWQAPPDYPPVLSAEGMICTDAIRKASAEPIVIQDLQNTSYAETAPPVARYQLQSYLGQAVRQGNSYASAVCVLYTEPIAPTEADCKLIGIIAGAIGVEEERAAAAERDRQKSQELQTALRQLQQTQMQLVQTEKMSSLGQMLAGIAHEINNPVGFVAGNVCHVRGYVLDLLELVNMYQKESPQLATKFQKQADDIDLEFLVEDLPKLLNSMNSGCKRIVEIIQSLRNFSRTDEAKMKQSDIHEGLESTLLLLNNRIKAKSSQPGVEIIKQYGNLPQVKCHSGLLNQAFMNILANAIDALEENSEQPEKTANSTSATITICTEIIDNTNISIRIKDNGPGIPEDTIVRLFDPFFTTKPVGKGTGLGLSISHQIVVQKHNGKLHCHSEIGKGTEFIIEIPIR